MKFEVGQLWMHRVTGQAMRLEELVPRGAKMQPVDDESHEPNGDPVGMTFGAIEEHFAPLPTIAPGGAEIGVTSDGKVRLGVDGAFITVTPMLLLGAAITGFQACRVAEIEIDLPDDEMLDRLREALR